MRNSVSFGERSNRVTASCRSFCTDLPGLSLISAEIHFTALRNASPSGITVVINPTSDGRFHSRPRSAHYTRLSIMVSLFSVHPETSDESLAVFDSERRHFSSWQGNRGVARRRTYVRRTSKPKD